MVPKSFNNLFCKRIVSKFFGDILQYVKKNYGGIIYDGAFFESSEWLLKMFLQKRSIIDKVIMKILELLQNSIKTGFVVIVVVFISGMGKKVSTESCFIFKIICRWYLYMAGERVFLLNVGTCCLQEHTEYSFRWNS